MSVRLFRCFYHLGKPAFVSLTLSELSVFLNPGLVKQLSVFIYDILITKAFLSGKKSLQSFWLLSVVQRFGELCSCFYTG